MNYRDDTALVGCLQGKEPGEFPKHEFSVLRRKELLGFPFVPTPDGDFLPDTPPRLLQDEHGQPMPIVAGFTANEGSHMLIFGAPSLKLENASNVGWEELLQVVRLTVPGAPEEAVRAVAQRYSKEGEGQGEARYRWAMDQIAGDYLYVCPAAEVARREAEAGSPVYAYYFTHRTSGLSTPEWTGVPHGSELPYLFGTLASVGQANHTHTEAEAVMSRRMMQYCGKFAMIKCGNLTFKHTLGHRYKDRLPYIKNKHAKLPQKISSAFPILVLSTHLGPFDSQIREGKAAIKK
uniref:Carboxylesterase type B domain-containing protein n=1 Tax=Chelydra serpentina TaxID=8475 RepID=A0A8C3T6U2_CHESE